MTISQQQVKPRLHWLDYAKIIGIFLVVLGHSGIPLGAVNFIYSFHMPLFFFLSGYLFDSSKYTSLRVFASQRFKQLLIPYFYFNIITYLFWVFIGRKFGNDAAIDISVFTPLIGILYGTDTGNYLVHCGSLWFLACLYVVEIIYYLMAKAKSAKVVLYVLLFCIAYINYKLKHVMWPFSFDVALIALIFYGLANELNPVIQNLLQLKVSFKLILTTASLAAMILLIPVNGRADMSSNTYQNYFLFLGIALIGILFTCLLSNLLADTIGRNAFVEYFAKNTIVILAFHSVAGTLIKGISHFVFKQPVELFQNVLFINVLFSIATFICLIPVIHVLNRYFPFMLGRTKSTVPNIR